MIKDRISVHREKGNMKRQTNPKTPRRKEQQMTSSPGAFRGHWGQGGTMKKKAGTRRI